MAKMVDIEKLKPLLSGVLNEENETSFLEGLMAEAVDYDESSVQGRIDEAVSVARAEEKANYSKKLHDMFFGSGEEVAEVADNDTVIDPEIDTVNEPETVSIDALLFGDKNE